MSLDFEEPALQLLPALHLQRRQGSLRRQQVSLEPQFILLLWRNTSLVEVWVLEADNCWHCLVETSLLNASSHNAALVPSIVSFYIVFEVFKWFSQMLTPF